MEINDNLRSINYHNWNHVNVMWRIAYVPYKRCVRIKGHQESAKQTKTLKNRNHENITHRHSN